MTRRIVPALVSVTSAVALAAVSITACSSAPSPTPSATAVTSVTVTTAPRPTGAGPGGTTPGGTVAGRAGIAGDFGMVTVTVRTADGTERRFCLLLADTPEQRQRGLMEVGDPSLGGYDGMLFRFPADTTGAFWMRNTILPLSIAYIAADGAVVSTADMVPCPDGVADQDCPTYRPDGAYRYAVEVPMGMLPTLGITEDATVTVAGDTCDGPPTAPSPPSPNA